MVESAEPSAGLPTAAEAMEWIGDKIDDLDGSSAGSVHGFFADAESGEPTWLIAKLGRRRPRLVAIPLSGCAGGKGRVWIAQERKTIEASPVVDPARPLLREHELTICSHFRIGEKVGRAAEVADRPEGAVTSRPMAG
ncbi:MAG TPA: hypothetical protein VF176_04670 [Solirubrobacterales bacterium]